MSSLISPFQQKILEIMESRAQETSTLDIERILPIPTLPSASHRYSFIHGELKSLSVQGWVDPATIHPTDPHKTTFLRRRR